MEGVAILDKENCTVAGNNAKGEKLVKGTTMVGSAGRRKLADITNLLQQNQDTKLQSISVNTKDYINKLHQENMTLVKLLAERNKIIELSAIELQKLRINYQKVQQQNLQLAQANSQMLAELNAGKDKLKALQHELGCKNGLLNTIKLEFKQQKGNTVRCPNHGNEVGTIKQNEVGEFFQEDEEYIIPNNVKKKRKSTIKSLEPTTGQAQERADKKRPCLRRQSARFKSGEQEPTEDLSGEDNALGLNVVEPVQDKKIVEKKRLYSRRQSARLKSQESVEDPFQIDDAKFPVSLHDDVVDVAHESCPTSSVSPLNCESARFESREQEPTEDSFGIGEAFGPNAVKSVQDKKMVNEKRLSSRCQSGRLKSQEPVEEPVEDRSQIEAAKFLVSLNGDVVVEHESCPASSILTLKSESETRHNDLGFEALDSRRSSIRPKRQVVEKVQSYKEIPLNVKMRRAG